MPSKAHNWVTTPSAKRRKPLGLLNSIVALTIISSPRRLASSWWICQYERMATVMLV